MNKIIAAALSLFSLLIPTSAIAQPATTSVTQVQVDKRDLIVVAARAIEDRKYKLALRVANNVTDLFPDYATGYLYRAIAFYKLGELQAAKLDFEKAKKLYTERSKSANLSADQKNEAKLGLEAIEIHLKLLKSKV